MQVNPNSRGGRRLLLPFSASALALVAGGCNSNVEDAKQSVYVPRYQGVTTASAQPKITAQASLSDKGPYSLTGSGRAAPARAHSTTTIQPASATNRTGTPDQTGRVPGFAAGPANTPPQRRSSVNASPLHALAVASRLESSNTHRATQARRGDNETFSKVSFAHEGADLDPDISRDGKVLVFASTRHGSTAELYTKQVDSRTVTQLTFNDDNDLMPALSPSGADLAFSSDRNGNWDIFVLPASGGRPIQITSASAHELHPSWSADGTKLAYSRLGTSGRWEIWVTDVSNPSVAQFIAYGMFPQWCPSTGTAANGGDKIAFQLASDRGDRSYAIWTIDYFDGRSTNFTEIASDPHAALINPTWSPDGEWIAYTEVPNAENWDPGSDLLPAATSLAMVHVSGNGRATLTDAASVNVLPNWGPNNIIYFISNREGIDNIWTLNASNEVELARRQLQGHDAVAQNAQERAERGVVVVDPN